MAHISIGNVYLNNIGYEVVLLDPRLQFEERPRLSQLWLSRFQKCFSEVKVFSPHDLETVLHPFFGTAALKNSAVKIHTKYFFDASIVDSETHSPFHF
jgi:hypothetical protein